MTAISVVGAGYVGLVTALGLAELGHDVICVDKDPGRIETISSGRAPFHEPGLDELIARNLGARFSITADLPRAVRETTTTFVAVGTPSGPGGIDLTHVLTAGRELGEAIRDTDDHHVIVMKSTVVPGTTDGPVREAIEQASGRPAGSGFSIASNPEFLTEGRAIADFFEPDRIVIGVDDAEAEQRLLDIYRSFGETPMVITNARTAEMIKYASNALLATMISFSNELANLGAAVGDIDTVDVMRGVHLSRYLTNRSASGTVTAEIASFLEAGCGFGGSCLPKDVAALSAHAAAHGVAHQLLDAVLSTNSDQPRRLVEIAERELGSLAGRTVAVLGLAFKPDTSDTRESPAFSVIAELNARGAEVLVHDPVARIDEVPGSLGAGATQVFDLATLVESADALLLVTRWTEYQELPTLLDALVSPPVLIDGRRLIDPATVDRYAGIGRS